MRWSPAMLAPWSRSRASPSAIFSLASRMWISETIPAHWSANAASEPTRPPPPMMLTFIWVARATCPCSVRVHKTDHGLVARATSDAGHDLVRDRLHERFQVRLADVGGEH